MDAAIVLAILADPDGGFVARAITRDPSSEKARELAAMGAEVVLTGLQIADTRVDIDPAGPLPQSIRVSKAITLSHEQNELTFEYVGLHSVDPEQIKYRYRLHGYDRDWIDAGGDRRDERNESLQPSQQRPRNVYVPLEWLAERLGRLLGLLGAADEQLTPMAGAAFQALPDQGFPLLPDAMRCHDPVRVVALFDLEGHQFQGADLACEGPKYHRGGDTLSFKPLSIRKP